MIIGTIRLAPGNVGYFDENTRIYLTLRQPEARVYDTMDTTDLKMSVKSGTIILVSGSLDAPGASSSTGTQTEDNGGTFPEPPQITVDVHEDKKNISEEEVVNGRLSIEPERDGAESDSVSTDSSSADDTDNTADSTDSVSSDSAVRIHVGTDEDKEAEQVSEEAQEEVTSDSETEEVSDDSVEGEPAAEKATKPKTTRSKANSRKAAAKAE